MSFKAVLRSLKEVFPQVDLRILQAVAIEHSNDIDAAVEFVLLEVLPALVEATGEPNNPHNTEKMASSLAEVKIYDTLSVSQGAKEENASLLPGSSVQRENDFYTDRSYEAHASSSAVQNIGSNSKKEVDNQSFWLHPAEDVVLSLPSEPVYIECEKIAVADDTDDALCVKSDLFDNTNAFTSFSANVDDQLASIKEAGAVTSMGSFVYDQLISNEDAEQQVPSVVTSSEIGGDLHVNVQGMYEMEDNGIIVKVSNGSQNLSPERYMNLIEFEEPLSRGLPQAHLYSSSNLEINDSVLASSSPAQAMPSSVPEDTLNLLEYGAPLNEVNSETIINLEEQNSRGRSEYIFEMKGLESDMSSAAEKPTVETVQSCSEVRVDILEDLITDVKSDKENLVSAFESLCEMMKAVELQEDRAKLAKEEVTKAGRDIFTMAEDMQQIVAHAKGSNAMHAGEVYGERTILAAEARELQSRLGTLSDEKDTSLSIIEHIQQILETRLAASKAEQTAAEHEKLEREEAARKFFKEQETIMDEVAQESKRLQEEAEENAKLREFLVVRGRLVEKLQGEITDICEDVLLLKEKVYARGTLEKSPPQSRSLASSPSFSSNHESLASEQILHSVGSEENVKGGSELSTSKIDVDGSDKAFSDGDWEIF